MVDIPFVRDIRFEYGVVERIAPGIRRVIADNKGPFTYTGTGTYIIGEGSVAVIDPGPRIESHIEAILAGLKGETVSHILITHTHLDHSPAAAPLKEATGAETWAYGPHGGDRRGEAVEEGGDWAFQPDHLVKHGDVIEGDGWSMEGVFTPGHTSNHMCFQYREAKALFTGDHVMGWSTSVISPPDGDMKAYMDSLRLLLDRDDAVYWPTHGPAITDPKPFVRAFIAHREEREAQIMACLRSDARYIPAMVKIMYANVGEHLHPAAARSVLAHLEHMVDTGRVVASTPKPTLHSLYTAVSR
ncbi:MAG: MBL fold metallo-hydrolase [Alphaproteobacteria bacterium]|nr:MBL fold metallo-hydrolase [Alphaproteobacteria bacterium]